MPSRSEFGEIVGCLVRTAQGDRMTSKPLILIEPGVTGEVRFVNKLFDLAA